MADFLKPDEILNELELKDNMLGAEFGCGSAEIAIALAKKLNKGRVYALDIQEEKLSALNGRINALKISNIDTILCDLEVKKGSTLRENSLDIVLIPNLLFQAEDKSAIISEAVRILKPNGQLLIIDWIKKTPFNQKSKIISQDEVKKIAKELKISFKKEFIAGDYHYALLFKK